MDHNFGSKFIMPSSREFFRQGRQVPGYTWFDWLHGYVYARWPYLYIGIGTGEHPLAKNLAPILRMYKQIFKHNNGKAQVPYSHEDILTTDQPPRITFADTYHGKVVPLGSAVQLVTVNEDIKILDLEKVIPYTKARDLILQNPDHILALECPCRSSRPNPCLPLDVCLIVGDPFASFVEEHHPQRSRRISPQEAVDILHAEDERGHVHHAFFKDAMLGRFYAICNCCSCCCGAMQAQRNGTPMLASSGYVSRVNEDLCIGCGDCQDYCQFDALSLGEYTAVINQAKCMGCGVCVSKCENGALSLERAPEKGIPLEICELMSIP